MHTLLIANRGEIACRVARSARAMGIRAVAVYSDADRHAVHIDAADEAVPIGGTAPGESYLRVDKLVEAARQAGADAVHPGYGFLAENAEFARACADAGLTFVGPSPAVIAAMGDKLVAKEQMRSAGVPVLPSVVVESPDDVSAASGLHFPVLVKAAGGGGGKGMRTVAEPAALADAVAAAQREAQAAFGGNRVFCEPCIARPRHVEVQIIGDATGTVLHIGERECSIQRRYQKVIEEAPSPAVDDELRERLCAAAVAAGRAIGYTNAGTVEFILDPSGGFFFLEVNTRLQVEHPVTELAWELRDGTPLDLVRLQLLVARGEPLPFTQEDLVLRRHAIEGRLYAEDPDADFLPATGTVVVWEPQGSSSAIGEIELTDVRWDSGVKAGAVVGVHYDPLLAKVIAAAPSRTEAAQLLAGALDGSRIHGVVTNRDFLVATLRHPVFLAGDLHTGFIAEHAPHAVPPDPAVAELHALAAALAAQRTRYLGQQVLQTIPPGWRNNRSRPQEVTYATPGGDTLAVAYHRRRDGVWVTEVGGTSREVTVVAWPDETGDALDIEVDGRRLRCHVATDGVTAYVDSPLGHSALAEQPRFPVRGEEDAAGSLHAPMPGTVLAVSVGPGKPVAKGDHLVTIEAMKMEHSITAPEAGTVTEVRVAIGDSVNAGDVLAVIDPD